MKIEDIKAGELYRHDVTGDVVEVLFVGEHKALARALKDGKEGAASPENLSPLPLRPPTLHKSKVRLMPIVWATEVGQRNIYTDRGGESRFVYNACNERGYIGYLDPDGTVRQSPVRLECCDFTRRPGVAEIESGTAKVMRATHVVCIEVAP